MDIIEVLKALADETRIRILNILYKETLCVCDLEEILELSQSNASRHLTKLKNARLITSEKQAQWVYYRVNEKILEEYSFVKELLEKELAKSSQGKKDFVRLKRYKDLGGSCECSIQIDNK